MEELNATIELKQSRTGHSVPVIGGVHLHSIYNPEKEAQAFAASYEHSIKKKSHILILGLGFGYHCEEVAQLASKYHENYKVVVIEPNQELVRLHNEAGGFRDPNIQVMHSKQSASFYDSIDFVMFLSRRPAILRHETSFNMNKDFYRNFLTFKAQENMHSYQQLLSDNARAFFPIKDATVDQALRSAKAAGTLKEKRDFAFFVLEAVVNSAKLNSKR